MKKNKLEDFSKIQSSTQLPSTDQNISVEQSRPIIESGKEYLIQKIKKLEFALKEANRQQQALLLKQTHLVEALNVKKKVFKSMNEEVICFEGQGHIKKQAKTHKKAGSMLSYMSEAVDNLSKNEYQQSQQPGTRYCTAGNTPSNKSPHHSYKFHEKKQNKLETTQSSNEFHRSYLKRCNNRPYMGCFYKNTNEPSSNYSGRSKYESIEDIWNQQRPSHLLKYRKKSINILTQ